MKHIFVVQRVDLDGSRARIAFETEEAARAWVAETIAINRQFNLDHPDLMARPTCDDSYGVYPIELCA